MADNVEKATNRARHLAIVHIIVGSLLFCLGIAHRVVGDLWTGHICFGIWVGTWVSRIGGLSTNVIFCSQGFVYEQESYEKEINFQFQFQCGFSYLESKSMGNVLAKKYSVEEIELLKLQIATVTVV